MKTKKSKPEKEIKKFEDIISTGVLNEALQVLRNEIFKEEATNEDMIKIMMRLTAIQLIFMSMSLRKMSKNEFLTTYKALLDHAAEGPKHWFEPETKGKSN